MLRSSYASTASATTAFWVFMAFYVACALVTWAVFLRRPSLRSVPADAEVVVEAEAFVREAEAGTESKSATSARA
jgi:NNP family nitrate/nitrite transporter-like MFS transporter